MDSIYENIDYKKVTTDNKQQPKKDEIVYENIYRKKVPKIKIQKPEEESSPIYENVYYKKVPASDKSQTNTDLLKKTQEEVEELVVILHNNVDQALERENKISDLNVMSENLEKRASYFKTQAVVVKRKEWRKRRRTKLIYAGICATIIVIIIVLLVCTFTMK